LSLQGSISRETLRFAQGDISFRGKEAATSLPDPALMNEAMDKVAKMVEEKLK
jgi:hypothetical protein